MSDFDEFEGGAPVEAKEEKPKVKRLMEAPERPVEPKNPEIKRLGVADVPPIPSRGFTLYACWDNNKHQMSECGYFETDLDPSRFDILCPDCKSRTVMPVQDPVPPPKPGWRGNFHEG